MYVNGIACDGTITNRRIWAELGINGYKTNLKNYFKHHVHSERNIYALSDFVHLLKCVSDRLYNNKQFKVTTIHIF